jgi:hypothetical protein
LRSTRRSRDSCARRTTLA